MNEYVSYKIPLTIKKKTVKKTAPQNYIKIKNPSYILLVLVRSTF